MTGAEVDPAPSPPAWFADLDQPRRHRLSVDEVDVSWVEWGGPDRPAVTLVHGMGAHSRWWDFVAAFLVDSFRVVAFDLSGHGTSGRRSRYEGDAWVREVWAVLEASGSEGGVLVGHSLGGAIAAAALGQRPSAAAGVMVIDSMTERSSPQQREGWGSPGSTRRTVFPSRDAARDRFRLLPPQPPVPWWVEDHIVEHGTWEGPAGWEWCFDIRAVHDYAGHEKSVVDELCRISGPRTVVGFESSTVFPEPRRREARERLPDVPFVEIPGAHHHAILDRPREVADVIRSFARDAVGEGGVGR